MNQSGMSKLEYLIKDRLKDFSKLLRFGRLATHEAIKVSILELGEELGYKVKGEVKVEYIINNKLKKGRIDAVWFEEDKIFSLFELDEGINTRSLCKLYSTPAHNKFFIMFDVRRKMQEDVNKFEFYHGVTPIQIW